MIAQTCSGVNVSGAPERGASASRAATGASDGPLSQRLRHWRTVFGQMPSWRAISRTAVPAAERKIISARSAELARRLVRPGETLQVRLLLSGQDNRRGGKARHERAPANQDKASDPALPC